jgi:alpha-D-ribose 1-methylphosphonate 5-triphosphate synthase subunit PhnG
MRVKVEVEEVELEDDRGRPVDGVVVCCGRCGHKVEVFGTGEASVKRGCVMLREECPEGESNFYSPD